jgi:hypothetical protein
LLSDKDVDLVPAVAIQLGRLICGADSLGAHAQSFRVARRNDIGVFADSFQQTSEHGPRSEFDE